MTCRHALVIALALAVTTVGATAAPGAPAAPAPRAVTAPESTGVTWGIAPADADGADGRVSFRPDLEPGEAHPDHVEVTNYSDRDVEFALVASDGVVGPDGSFDLLPSDEQPVDTGAWIEIDETVTVPAMESAVVPFTLTVPEDALPGDHPGGIAASVVSAGDDAVLIDSRVGARIHLRVAGDIVPTIAVSDIETQYRPSWNPLTPGQLDLSWTVANEGNVRLGATTAAAVTGLFGLSAGDAELEPVREVLAGDEVRQSVTVEAWPFGPLTAAIDVTPGIVGEDVVDAELSAAFAAATAWAVPWVQIALLVLVAGIIAWQVRARRRRRAAWDAALTAARQEAVRAVAVVGR